jgi:hypothetical protein
VNFIVNLQRPGDFVLKVLDVSGREVWRHTESNVVKGSHEVAGPIVTGSPNNGIYVAVLKQNKEQISQKILMVK